MVNRVAARTPLQWFVKVRAEADALETRYNQNGMEERLTEEMLLSIEIRAMNKELHGLHQVTLTLTPTLQPSPEPLALYKPNPNSDSDPNPNPRTSPSSLCLGKSGGNLN